VLEASLLEEPAAALHLLFGDRGDAVATDLAALGVGQAGGTVVRDALRERLRREEGSARVRSRAEALATRLAEAGAWEAALGILGAHADATALGGTLARALRAVPPLAADRARRWIELLEDDAVLGDADLAVARAAFHQGRGDTARALEVLRRALGGALRSSNRDDGPRLAAHISQLAGEHAVAGAAPRPRVTGEARLPHRAGWPSLVCLAGAAALLLAAAWPGRSPPQGFLALLSASRRC
jgi:hypothetical protein